MELAWTLHIKRIYLEWNAFGGKAPSSCEVLKTSVTKLLAIVSSLIASACGRWTQTKICHDNGVRVGSWNSMAGGILIQSAWQADPLIQWSVDVQNVMLFWEFCSDWILDLTFLFGICLGSEGRLLLYLGLQNRIIDQGYEIVLFCQIFSSNEVGLKHKLNYFSNALCQYSIQYLLLNFCEYRDAKIRYRTLSRSCNLMQYFTFLEI